MSKKSKAPPPKSAAGRTTGPSSGGTLAHLVPGARPAVGVRGGAKAAPPTGNPRALAAEGHRHLSKGDVRGAERRFREALSLDDRCAPALAGLGMVAGQAGHLEPAARLFLQAATVEPNQPDHGVNAGSALWRLGQRDTALGVFAETAKRAPRFGRARVAYGTALMEAGRFDDAEAEARAARALDRRDAAALSLLGRVLTRAGRPSEAIAPLEAVAARAKNDPGAANDLAMALSAAGRREEAIAVWQKATERAGTGPGAVELGVNLAGALLAEQRADAAETVLRDLLARVPDHIGARLTLGDALQRQGRFDAARAAFSAVLEREPGNVGALRGLAKSGTVAAGDPMLEALRTAAAEPDQPESARIEILFALGKGLDDAGADPAAVFGALAEANARQGAGRPDDIPARTALVDRSIDVFTPDLFESLAALGNPSERPVFIVGMPRSGTSLVEQMIASHPAAVGAGELGVMPNVERTLREGLGGGYPAGLANVPGPQLADGAARVLAELDAAAQRAGKPEALRVTDKLPDNAMRLGLIALLFPRARVIVCRRDPMDTGLSLFQQNFSDGIPYANGLETIGAAMVQHDRLMAHWRAVLPLWTLTVDYETLVTDLEGEGRRMIDFLGLPWDDAVLRFHETERAVYTASKWQVRQPVFTHSVGRWRRYAKQLEPLRAVLDENGLLDRGV
ncbi:tetratricopeptide repeat-containing sulfotransferase family protein [Roseospira marina]|nr:tetratricopeptide repeat-containing sulfotransferase family protein [Roseospira marina]MBB4313213.1 tetratricopeptide (TPR) repeat protein [Roseospira marina]MBB5086046.1 tetratricopeptide (TPR) repeat protein [Roseospira marina]